MKQIKCSRCGKTVEVPEDWQYKRCPECHEKDKDYTQVKKNVRQQEREAEKLRESIDLDRNPSLRTYSDFRRAFSRFGEPTFEKYLKFLRDMKEKQRRENIDVRTKESLQKIRENKLVNALTFPLENEDCRTYRLSRAKTERSPEEDEFLAHVYKCENCTKWLKWFKDRPEEPTKEGEMSYWDKPTESGTNIWNSEETKQESHEEKAKRIQRESGFNEDFKRTVQDETTLDSDLDREDFGDSYKDFRKKRKS
jgi:DNA-directed RNA polymerase subunit RPC12/RpoP